MFFIAILSIGLYTNTLKNGFVLDDEDVIINSPLIKDFNNVNKLFDRDYFYLSGEMSYRPVVTLSYFTDYKLSGLKPWGYHLTNILLHATNSILLYFFLSLIVRPSAVKTHKQPLPQPIRDIPLLISLLFVAHPILTEAVNVPSYREDLLVFLFYIGALNLYLSIRSSTISQSRLLIPALYLLSCILYLLALFSKEMAVTLPLMVYCYEWIYTDKRGNKNSIFLNPYNIGYFGITFIYIYIRFYYFHNPASLVEVYAPAWGFAERLLTIPLLILNYMKLSIFPISLSSDHIIDPVRSVSSFLFIAPVIIVSSLLAIAITVRSRKKEIAFGILYFFITLIPVYNIVPIAIPIAERYLYLPIAGFAIIAGALLKLVLEAPGFKFRRLIIFIILFFTVSLYSIKVIERNEIWGNDYLFWTDTVKNSPKSDRAHLNLGAVYFDQERFDEAIREVKTAIKLNPLDPQFYTLLGMIYAKQGRLDDAISEFRTVLRLMPTHPGAHYNLGVAYLKKGLNIEGMAEFEMVLRLRPDYLKAKQAIEHIDKDTEGVPDLDFTDVYIQ